jgi:alkyl sulfatase BDS1-like metallo-beta-lactamase superfamily hydrolase
VRTFEEPKRSQRWVRPTNSANVCGHGTMFSPVGSMLERSAAAIDGDEVLPLTGLMSATIGDSEEVAPGVCHIEAFSNVVAFATDDGVVAFDAAHRVSAHRALASLRAWSDAPLHTLVYTHGHTDHVTGAPLFVDDATAGGHQLDVVGHESVDPRFERYVQTAGYNGIINMRQFRLPEPMWPTDYVHPTQSYRDELLLEIGGVEFRLFHARGETDDHTWTWIPSRKAITVGDLFIWQFPNAGNPAKVQRYAIEWAVALRRMLALEPELMLPAHGLPIAGRERIARVLGDTASALEHLHRETLAMMNAGATLDEVIHTVALPPELAGRSWLQPTYDEPEFVVRNIWRLYGGWYDGNPARLKPAPDSTVAAEVAALAGGAAALARRAEQVADDGDLRLACQLIEWATHARPDDRSLHETRADIYERRRAAELSFMASGIFRAASLDSAALASG